MFQHNKAYKSFLLVSCIFIILFLPFLATDKINTLKTFINQFFPPPPPCPATCISPSVQTPISPPSAPFLHINIATDLSPIRKPSSLETFLCITMHLSLLDFLVAHLILTFNEVRYGMDVGCSVIGFLCGLALSAETVFVVALMTAAPELDHQVLRFGLPLALVLQMSVFISSWLLSAYYATVSPLRTTCSWTVSRLLAAVCWIIGAVALIGEKLCEAGAILFEDLHTYFNENAQYYGGAHPPGLLLSVSSYGLPTTVPTSPPLPASTSSQSLSAPDTASPTPS